MTPFLNRLFWSAITLLGTAILTFFLINAVPGDVARVIAGPKATAEVLEQIRELHHLNDPVLLRLVHYLGQLASGDLGYSYATEQAVSSALLTRFPATAALSLTALVMWVIVAVPLGALTARYRGSKFDRTVLVLASITLALPSFWLARMMQFSFAYKVGWFPVAGLHSITHILLPSITLAILFVGYYARLIHTNMVEVLDSPYIRAARAKGASEKSILFHHALRNAVTPVITILGMDVAALLGGILFIETIFGLPGIGTLALQSVLNLDVPMIMGTVLFSATIVVGANLAVDVVYRWIDPRIKNAS